MKKLLTMALVVLMAGTASAQLENSMGIFFDEEAFLAENTNFDPQVGVEFEMYIVLLNTTVNYVGGYEVGLEITDPAVVVLGWGGPDSFWEGGAYVYPDGFSYGGTNFGDNLNQLVGYAYPVPTYGVEAVLAKMRMIHTAAGTAEMFMGPSDPSSVDGAGPAIANGLDPEDLIVCNYTSGPDMGGLVATLNGSGIEFPVATEAQSWSGVKALFD